MRSWHIEAEFVDAGQRDRKEEIAGRSKVAVYPFSGLDARVSRLHDSTESPDRDQSVSIGRHVSCGWSRMKGKIPVRDKLSAVVRNWYTLDCRVRA